MLTFKVALNYWEVFLLILVRVASFVYAAPFFNMPNTPNRVKLGFAFFLSIIIFTIIPERSLEYTGIVDYAMLIVKESMVGLLIGFGAFVCVQTLHFAGHIVDVNIGLAMATEYDPQTQNQVTISGNLYYYVVFLCMLVSGLHQFLITAIVDTYDVVPLGTVSINSTLYSSWIEIVAQYFIIGFRIALPVFMSVMLVNVVLGVLTRVAPQINMFAVGIQIKLLAGLAILFFTVGIMPQVSTFINEMVKKAITSITGGFG